MSKQVLPIKYEFFKISFYTYIPVLLSKKKVGGKSNSYS